jgi:hypothetical protein
MTSGHLDTEPSEALWPETKGQAASLARVRGHLLHGAGRIDPVPAACPIGQQNRVIHGHSRIKGHTA